MSFMRIFGCKAFALRLNKKEKNFKPTGKEYVFAGYSSESKGYRLWERGTKTVIKSRDVRFVENINNSNFIRNNTFELPMILSSNDTVMQESNASPETDMKNSHLLIKVETDENSLRNE